MRSCRHIPWWWQISNKSWVYSRMAHTCIARMAEGVKRRSFLSSSCATSRTYHENEFKTVSDTVGTVDEGCSRAVVTYPDPLSTLTLGGQQP